MIKQLDIEQEYKEVFALSQFAFQYKLSENELQKEEEEARRHIIWGQLDEGKIASKLHLIPLSIYIGGKVFAMGGISSVATWPEYRRGGLVKELLQHALYYMKSNGYTISYLHPFSVPFYRKYGWELAFNEKSYTIPIEKLKKKWNTKGYVRTKSFDYQTINSIYNVYAKKYSGSLVRDEKWWKQRILKDNAQLCVAYDNQGQSIGYIHFEVKENVFHVHDWAYVSIDGLNIMLEFIANHDSMVQGVKMKVAENDLLPLIIDEPRFEQKVEPYFMARIVDVSSFLNEYPLLASTGIVLKLHVTDDFLPENTRTYHVSTVNNQMNVTVLPYQMEEGNGIHCSIQYLTMMFLGYARPVDLYRIGLIEGTQADVEKLEVMIPDQQPYFPDFF